MPIHIMHMVYIFDSMKNAGGIGAQCPNCINGIFVRTYGARNLIFLLWVLK